MSAAIIIKLAVAAVGVFGVAAIIRRQLTARARGGAHPGSRNVHDEDAEEQRLLLIERIQLLMIGTCVLSLVAMIPVERFDLAPLLTIPLLLVTAALAVVVFLALEFRKGWTQTKDIIDKWRKARARDR